MNTTNRGYLTIVEWPASLSEPDRATMLADVCQVDPHRARELSRRPTPAIFKRDDVDSVSRCAQFLRAKGVLALCVPAAQIRALLSPTTVRSVTRSDDGHTYTFVAPHDSATLTPSDAIVTLVRARPRDHAAGPGTADLGLRGAHSLQGSLSADDWNQGPTARRQIHTLETLDIHTRQGGHFRLICGHCAFHGFVMDKDDAAKAAMDSVTQRFADDCPGATVVTAFDHAQFMAEYVGDFGPAHDWRSLAGLNVYSAWARHLAVSEVA